MQSDWLQPPFSVTDLIAALLWVLAALYVTLQRRDHEPGMGWFAAAMVLFALFVGNNARHLPTDPVWLEGTRGWYLVVLSGIACLGVGFTHYVGLQGRARAWVLAAIVAPLAVAAAIALAVEWQGLQFRRQSWNVILSSSFIGMACLAFWARRRERSAGHGYIGLAFLLVPGTALLLVAQGSPAAHLRYWGFIPVLVIGLTLLTVSLLRRRRMLLDEVARRAAAERSLADTNATLEAQVEARTRELRDVIDGLESFNRQISHDLRGPLGGIGGLAQLAGEALQRGDLAAAQRLLPPIGQQAAVTARLVDALLMLARSGDVALNKAPLPLVRLTHEVAQGLQQLALAGEKGPSVEIGEMPVVEADETLLRAVMTNLIGNAIKFSAGRPDGKVRISAEEKAGTVTVAVADNGVGFDPSAAATLFQPFTRLHGARFAGAGIGLTIVRRIVERHGGKVWAVGQPDAGAIFSFTLPAAR
ncbi:MAG TPA: HAMP domain-containing sensor histidine kinase [Burkholderiaceae bacterium]